MEDVEQRLKEALSLMMSVKRKFPDGSRVQQLAAHNELGMRKLIHEIERERARGG